MVLTTGHHTKELTCFVTDERKSERAVVIRPQAWVIQRCCHTLLMTRVRLSQGPVAKQRRAAVGPPHFPVQADPQSSVGTRRQGCKGRIFPLISYAIIKRKSSVVVRSKNNIRCVDYLHYLPTVQSNLREKCKVKKSIEMLCIYCGYLGPLGPSQP